MKKKKLNKYFVRQQDQSDCGIACLSSVIQFYGGACYLEDLRIRSGTNIGGTTMLGLYQAANEVGLMPEGVQMNAEALIEYDKPCILHVSSARNLQHYIVYYETIKSGNEINFLVGDPAHGIKHITVNDLKEMWESGAALLLIPSEKFKKKKALKNEKIKWFINLVKEDLPAIIITSGLSIITAFLSVVMVIFTQRLIDVFLPKHQNSKLYGSLILVLLLLLIKEALSAFRQMLVLGQTKAFNLRIIDFFYSHLLQLPRTFFSSRKTGDLTSRLADTNRIQRVISMFAGNLVSDAFVVFVMSLLLISYSQKIGAACVITMVFFYCLVRTKIKTIEAAQSETMRNYALTEANYISTLQGIESIKNESKEDLFNLYNNSLYKKYQDSVVSLGMIQVRLSLMINLFSVFVLGGLFFFASYEVLHGHLRIGQLVAILSTTGTIMPGIVSLAMTSIPLSEAGIVFDRMFEFTNTKKEDVSAGNDINAISSISVNNITFRFPGNRLILKGASLKAKKGEVISIMGENGGGKSTIMHILQRHFLAESGDIVINDLQSLDSYSKKSWRNIIGVVPQNIHLFNGTVLENIVFDDANSNPVKALSFLDSLGFIKYFDTFPQSYGTVVAENAINLSGGQKQLIAIARALYKKPQLLLLDEATSAMDRNLENWVLELLNKLKTEMIIIYVTHRLHILKSFADKIFVLEEGTMSQSGSHNELVKGRNLYSEYWKDLHPGESFN